MKSHLSDFGKKKTVIIPTALLLKFIAIQKQVRYWLSVQQVYLFPFQLRSPLLKKR
jgi:hypothetical protein